MSGLDLLGVDTLEEHLVGVLEEHFIGAATTQLQPTLSKMDAAASHVAKAAAKLQKLNPKLAAKLKALSSLTSSKRTKLQQAGTKAAKAAAKPVAASIVPKPAIKPPPVRPVVKPLPRVAPAAAIAPSRASSVSPAKTATPSAALSPRMTALTAAKAHLGFDFIGFAESTDIGIFGPQGPIMNAATESAQASLAQGVLDAYYGFGSQVDDAGVAADAVALVQPLLPQIQTVSPTLYTAGNGIISQANAIISAVQAPADPSTTAAFSSLQTNTVSTTGQALMQQATAWVQQARALIPDSATPVSGQPWVPATQYPVGMTATNNGNTYSVVTAGKSGGSPGPTGTTGSIVDGTVTWQFVSAAPAAQWRPYTAYVAGATVTNNGNGYTAQTAGTSGPAPGPTSQIASTPITDGNVTWMYTGVATGTVAVQGAQWMPSTAYAAGSTVTNNGNSYLANTSGTSGPYPGPTSTTMMTPVTDGTVTWQFTSNTQMQQQMQQDGGGGGGGGDDSGDGSDQGSSDDGSGGGDDSGDGSDDGSDGSDDGSDGGGGYAPGSALAAIAARQAGGGGGSDDGSDGSDDGSGDGSSDGSSDGSGPDGTGKFPGDPAYDPTTDPTSSQYSDPFASVGFDDVVGKKIYRRPTKFLDAKPAHPDGYGWDADSSLTGFDFVGFADSVGHGGGGHGGGHGGGRGGRFRGSYGGGWGWDDEWNDGLTLFAIDDPDDDLDTLSTAVAKKLSGRTLVGDYDIAAAQKQMNTLKSVTVAIARALVQGGQKVATQTIAVAQGGLLQATLPGITSLKNTQGHLQWHSDALAKLTDPTAIYASGDDLKKWTVQAWIDSNVAAEGRASQNETWSAMWTQIGAELAKLPAETIKAVTDVPGQIIHSIFGIPLWAFWGGVSVLVVIVGFGLYKLIKIALPAATKIAAARYLP